MASRSSDRPAPLPGERQAGPLIYDAKKHAACRTGEYLYSQLIPYIGNKRKLLWMLAGAIHATGAGAGTFVDFFAGSGVVARLAKSLGFRVIANDWEPYACTINGCYISCNALPAFDELGGAAGVYRELNSLAPIEGYIATHMCPRDDEHPDADGERMFFTRANGGKIDAMREQIACWERDGRLGEDEKAVLLASLIYSGSYVSNTSGVFKGFHRGWGGQTRTALYRILSAIQLQPPVLFDNGQANEALGLDAQSLAWSLRERRVSVDIAYVDPPYNQHPYGSNYHLLNTLVLWDKPPLSPAIGGKNKAAIRDDWRTTRRSAYNHATALDAYDLLLRTIDARYILTSYSTDGNIPLRAMLESAAGRGAICCLQNPYKRYRVSAQRRSPKPVNVEFVLIVDTRESSHPPDIDRLYDEITRAESAALSAHGATRGQRAEGGGQRRETSDE